MHKLCLAYKKILFFIFIFLFSIFINIYEKLSKYNYTNLSNLFALNKIIKIIYDPCHDYLSRIHIHDIKVSIFNQINFMALFPTFLF